jgi:hypothetical protein
MGSASVISICIEWGGYNNAKKNSALKLNNCRQLFTSNNWVFDNNL